MPPVSTTINASIAGTYFLEDDGIPGNNFSRIRFPDGTIVVFEHPTGDLNFNVLVPGVNLVVNLTDSLGTANLNVGDLTSAAASPDLITVGNIRTSGAVTLVSNGAITELGSDAAADIRAASVVFSAQTGVGTAGNAIETQVGALEAETVTGGITLGNFGTVAIGGLTNLVPGLDVVTSGDIKFTNYGTIILSDVDGAATVDGGSTSGNVTLTAVGDSDIIPNVDRASVRAPRGDINLTAGRDIAFGIIGTNFNNDVIANGNLTVNAGRDVIIDGFADFSSDSFGQSTGGDVVVNAGRDINIIGVAGTSASIFASGIAGGNVTLNTGAGGTFNFSSPQPDGLSSNSGDIFINADRVLIDAVANIRTFDGDVFIRPRTGGRSIDLGSGTDTAQALELSSTELGRIFTSNLRVGDPNSGTITVTAPVSFTNAPNVTLQTGTDILVQSNMTVTASLTLRAGDDVLLSPSTINVPIFTAFADQAGDDGNTGGVISLNSLVASTTSTLTGNAEADRVIGTSANETILGLGGNDILSGAGGNDSLDGGTGNDNMAGGLGDDFFFVDSATDAVGEAAGEGNDRVFASVSYTLAAGQSVEKLTTTLNTGTTAINLTGNELAQQIFGNDGANTLDGRGGADQLIGLKGDDFYFVDDAGDTIQELAGQGSDRVFASVSYTLGAGQSVEKLTTNSNGATTAINLTGNELVQDLFGNAGVNVLDGKSGSDTLTGFAGADTFAFTTALGAGNVDAITDFVSGTDKISLENAIFTGLAGGALPAGAFATGTAATQADDRIIYNTATGALLFDADGIGGAAAVQFATLQGAPALAASDFVVV